MKTRKTKWKILLLGVVMNSFFIFYFTISALICSFTISKACDYQNSTEAITHGLFIFLFSPLVLVGLLVYPALKSSLKKITSIFIVFFLCGCSAVIVYAPKEVHSCGSGPVHIIGSDLKGNDATQDTNAAFKFPWMAGQ